MRKLIAAINMTLDGFCDHTAVIPDGELHQHYADLLSGAGLILYGRITYQLMEYWPIVLKKPIGNPTMDEFALTIDRLPKMVFSRTLKEVSWASARLSTRAFEEEVLALKQEPGKDILVGSPSLIVAGLNHHLIDEFQLCIHPVVAGDGLPLFKNIQNRVDLTLLKTKPLGSGAVVFYYEPAGKG